MPEDTPSESPTPEPAPRRTRPPKQVEPAKRAKGEPLQSVGQWRTELTGRDAAMGKAFEASLRERERRGADVRKRGTAVEWRAEFEAFKKSAI